MHVAIVTPIFAPARGGAAVYYGLLSAALIDHGIVTRITVYTERFPGLPSEEATAAGRLVVRRRFPFRAGGAIAGIGKYARYGFQNLQYRSVVGELLAAAPDVLVVHSSFMNQANLMHRALRVLSGRVRLVADVRDHEMPRSMLGQLEQFDAIIACSENVAAHVAQNPGLSAKTVSIPVPQESIEPPAREHIARVLASHRAQPRSYLLYAGSVKPSKGVGLLLESYAAYRRSCAAPVDLLIAGVGKDGALAATATGTAGVRLVGALPRPDLLALMSGAAMNVNLSSSEGMPRVCLEALALGTRVLLPAGVPEFARYCPASVVRSTQASVVAAQIAERLAAAPCTYPVERHGLSALLPLYEAVLYAH